MCGSHSVRGQVRRAVAAVISVVNFKNPHGVDEREGRPQAHAGLAVKSDCSDPEVGLPPARLPCAAGGGLSSGKDRRECGALKRGHRFCWT